MTQSVRAVRYHPIIFAPDSNNPDGGPLVELERAPISGLGVQTTLPVDAPRAVLLNAKGEGIFFVKATPRSRRIGFEKR